MPKPPIRRATQLHPPSRFELEPYVSPSPRQLFSGSIKYTSEEHFAEAKPEDRGGEDGGLMSVDRGHVLETLQALDGKRALGRLLERVLGYDGDGGLVSTDGWPEEVSEGV